MPRGVVSEARFAIRACMALVPRGCRLVPTYSSSAPVGRPGSLARLRPDLYASSHGRVGRLDEERIALGVAKLEPVEDRLDEIPDDGVSRPLPGLLGDPVVHGTAGDGDACPTPTMVTGTGSQSPSIRRRPRC